MTDDPSAPAGAPRWMRLLLVASLALNLLVAGLLLGDALAGGPGRPPRPELALGPFARALDEGDRRAILEALRGRPELRPLGREGRAADLDAVRAALRAEPFDEAALRDALARQAGRMADLQAAVTDALVARLAAMTPEARRAFADRLDAGPPGGPH